MKDLNLAQRRSTIEDFDLFQCIDRGLEKFGGSFKQTIYWKISILYGSPHDAIISNPDVLIQVIRATFRDSAAGVEKYLLDEIETKLGHLENCSTLQEALMAIKDQIEPARMVVSR